MSIEDEIEETKRKLRETPVNKSTETDRARLKSKIARLKEKREVKQKESGASGQGYAVRKRGDATVALVGPPSVGKSTLLNKLTNADSEVAGYDFTTLDVVPGMMEYRGAKIQLLDVPGLISGAAEGKGKGKEVLSVIRNCDMLIIVVDEDRLNLLDRIKDELYEAGVRINREPPKVDLDKKEKGGIQVSKPEEMEMEEETIKDVLKDHGFVNCKIVIRERVSLDELIDGIMNNRVYLPRAVCLNKIDSIDEEKHIEIKESNSEFIFLSAEMGTNLRKLKNVIWEKLRLSRIYMKERRKEADKEEPLIVERGSTVEDAMDALDKEFKGDLKYAKIWGNSAKFPGQKVGKDHVLKDEDVLELRF